MDLGLTEFLKLSPLQATFAIVFGRLRVPARYEAPPEIADRVEPRIAVADGPESSTAEPRMTAIVERNDVRQPYIGRLIEPRRNQAIELRQPHFAATGAPKKARMLSD